MKNLLLATALLALVTTTVVEAYVQTGHLQQPSQAASTVQQGVTASPGSYNTNHDNGNEADASLAGHEGGAAAAPAPEPGTLTVAAMGLLALGVAWRSRRGC